MQTTICRIPNHSLVSILLCQRTQMLTLGLRSNEISAITKPPETHPTLPAGAANNAPKNKNPAEPRLCGVLSTTSGGDGGIRTLDPGFGPDAPLAGECLRPLGHVSQTFGRAGSQRDEAKIIAGRTTKVNVWRTFFVPVLSLTTQFIHIDHAKQTERSCTPRCSKQITLDPVRTLYAARARRAPYTSRRSTPRS